MDEGIEAAPCASVVSTERTKEGRDECWNQAKSGKELVSDGAVDDEERYCWYEAEDTDVVEHAV